MQHRALAPIITAGEYGRVALPPPLNTALTRERLEEAGLRAGFGVFETRRRQLYARGVVGVVDVGNVIVEVLPKVRTASHAGADTAFLGELLRFTGAANDLGFADAAIATGSAGLLDVIFSWAARTIAANLREGVPRRYVVREETSTAVRGRVELRELVRQRPGRGFELTVRHAPLCDDNGVSQTIKWLVNVIVSRTRSLRTRALCLQLKQQLATVSDRPPAAEVIHRLTLSRLEDHWAPLIALARVLMVQGEPDPARGGRLQAVSLLFTLHDLFERALRRIFSEGAADVGMKLRAGGGYLLAGVSGNQRLIRLLPDFHFDKLERTEVSLVGDAKWKRIFDETGRVHLTESDAHQVTSYVAALGASASFIISPTADPAAPIRSRSMRIQGLDRPLSLIGVHLPALIRLTSEGVNLRRRLCALVSDMATNSSPALARS